MIAVAWFPTHGQLHCAVDGCTWESERGDVYGMATCLATHLFLRHGITCEVTP